jgi:precorrin-8X/cobalt-precorrin-8 methylmutase
MISVGLSQERLSKYNCPVHCFISDEDVINRAKTKNTTRAIESVQKAKDRGVLDGSIIAIGNAPTALLEICNLVEIGEVKPALIIGVPVGFVSAPESKEACLRTSVPYITTMGRKGGSPVAVAIIHALLTLSAQSDR